MPVGVAFPHVTQTCAAWRFEANIPPVFGCWVTKVAHYVIHRRVGFFGRASFFCAPCDVIGARTFAQTTGVYGSGFIRDDYLVLLVAIGESRKG